ncbi:hypothetical protein PFLmoz3_02143 [Pseudomonas fluorescens]|uniref:Uncharacterized protein n=1 Tax=Pseudomonas fluorescens TaxID=294 RepID=A0A109LK61_PSEFL|nr:hypothetical protein PFLmoz3_02143 [Pseudomonas fluorescens]
MPGTIANTSMATEAIIQLLGSLVIWRAISAPMFVMPLRPSGATRVMIMPAVREINSAGICAIRPSPIVSTEYSAIESAALKPCWNIPVEKPPNRLTTTMINPAMASPLTNFMAPSMAPNS